MHMLCKCCSWKQGQPCVHMILKALPSGPGAYLQRQEIYGNCVVTSGILPGNVSLADAQKLDQKYLMRLASRTHACDMAASH